MKIHKPKTKISKRFSFLTSIWIVPIAAFLISLWLAYQYFAQMGSEIEIHFRQNSGLSANQSYIKYRDVPIGVVKNVSLEPDGDGVIVTIRMNKHTDRFLNDTTKFWIVKPEVGTSGISGLDTLISGTYIQMYAQSKNESTIQKYFEGLESPYIDRNTDTGYRYHLSASDSRNLHVGSPIYYRKIRVGEVEQITLQEDGTRVNFEVFIRHPYTYYIHQETQFWLMSNLSFSFNHSGFNLGMAPMSHILNGGITFDTPAQISHQKKNQGISHVFFLYEDKIAMQKKRIGLGEKHQYHYLLLVDEPIAKLDVGAPVEFFGFQVGSVVAMNSDFDNSVKKIISTIEVVIDTSAFADKVDKNTKDTKLFFEKAVQKGLRARISQTDPITGGQYIELVYAAQEGQREIKTIGANEILPTISSNDVNIAQKLSSLLDKVDALDLNALLESVQKAVDNNSEQSVKILKEFAVVAKNLKKISSDPQIHKMPQNIATMMTQLQSTLEAMNALLQADGEKSALSKEITLTLKELTKASKSIDKMTKKLDKKPNALIFGDE